MQPPATAPIPPAAPLRARSHVAPFALILIGTLAIGILVWPVFPGLTLAAVLATLLYPVHKRVLARVHRPWVAAALSTLGAALVILLLLSGILFIVGTESMTGIEWLSTRQQGAGGATDGIRGALIGFARRFGVDPTTLVAAVEAQVSNAAGMVASRTLGFLSGI